MTSSLAVIRRDWDAPILERRSSLENPQTPLSYPAEWLLDIFNGGRTDSGIRVSELSAFQVVTFLSCVDLIAGSIAALPLHVYERSFLQKSGRAVHKVAYDHDLYDLIHTEPNDEMSRFTLIKALMVHILAWSNGYIELQRDGGNSVTAFWPRNPAKTRPYRLSHATHLKPVLWRPFPVNIPAGTLVYRTTDGIDDQDRSENDAESGQGRIIPAEDMVHVTGLSFDGRIGHSTVWLSRQILGLYLATEKFGAKYFANFARPGGILEIPYSMGSPQYEQAKRSWQEAQGGENSNRIAAMPPGMKWTATSHNPEEAQTTQHLAFLRNQICSVFHVPPHMVGDVDKGKANTEQLAQEFVSYTLGPWLAAIKQEFKRKLFPNSGIGRTPKSRFFVDFDLHEMLRPDAASREAFYRSGRQWGYLNTNDIREYEKLNPIDEPWAEDYWIPINMTSTETPLDPNNQDGAGKGTKPDQEPADQKDGNGKEGNQPPDVKNKTKSDADAEEEARSYVAAFSRFFTDAFGRILRRNNPSLRDFNVTFLPVLSSIADMYARVRGSQVGQETDGFIAGYIVDMRKRSGEWKDVDSSCKVELDRAVRAIRVAVYRDIAGQQALALPGATE